MDIGKQQRVIMVEPIGLTLDEELEELARDLTRPGGTREPSDSEEKASSDPLE